MIDADLATLMPDSSVTAEISMSLTGAAIAAVSGVLIGAAVWKARGRLIQQTLQQRAGGVERPRFVGPPEFDARVEVPGPANPPDWRLATLGHSPSLRAFREKSKESDNELVELATLVRDDSSGPAGPNFRRLRGYP